VEKRTFDELVTLRLSAAEAATVPRHPVVAVLHNVRSLYNVGSIFRTADAMHLQGLFLTGYTPAPPRSEIAKTALGADRVVPFTVEPDVVRAIAELKASGIRVYAAELAHGALGPSDVDLADGPVAVVFGNELTGLPNDVLALCDGAIEIPMYGTKHSLNVAVAAGIILHSLVERQRKNTP
jgi:tRNA G18 (ribose-2'-O)-methylase SpoU